MKTRTMNILAGVTLVASMGAMADNTADKDRRQATNPQATTSTSTKEVPSVLTEVTQQEVLPMQKLEMEQVTGLGPVKSAWTCPCPSSSTVK